MTRTEEILFFWFADPQHGPLDALGRTAMWFGVRPELDQHIRAEFGGDLERARRGELEAWAATPRGRLALLLVLDQFSRNIHRGTPDAFANDAHSLQLAREGLDAGADRSLGLVERIFFYLPFQHSEAAGDQAENVRLYEELLAEAPPAVERLFQKARQEAVLHQQVILRFGRFPHRNHVLGRTSTSEEEAFLVDGPTWGQAPPNRAGSENAPSGAR